MARWGRPDKPKPPRQGRGTPSLPLRRLRPAFDRNNAFSLIGRSWRPDIPARRRSRRMAWMQERPSAGLTECRQIHAQSELSAMNSTVNHQGPSKSPVAHDLVDGRRPERTPGEHARPDRKQVPLFRRAAPHRGDGFPLCFAEHNALPLTSSRMASHLQAIRQFARNALRSEEFHREAAQAIRTAEVRHRGQRRPSARPR